MKTEEMLEAIIEDKKRTQMLKHLVETHQLVMHYTLREHSAGRDLTQAFTIMAVMKAQMDDIIGEFPEDIIDKAIPELMAHIKGKH